MKYQGRLQRALNVATILMGVVLLGVAAKFTKPIWSAPSSSKVVATPVETPKTAALGSTLVLYMGTDCIFCEKSMPFYKALIKASEQRHIRTIAVFEDSVGLAQEYLKRHELAVDEVRQASFTILGVHGTPTLRLLDDQGHPVRTWPGLLTSTAEADVVDSLGAREAFVAAAQSLQRSKQYRDAAQTRPISADELLALVHANPAPVIVDTRERRIFSHGHIENAINMPYDELRVRAPIELANAGTVVVFCSYDHKCEEERRAHNTLTQCSMAGSIVKGAGVDDVRLVTATLHELRVAKVPMGTTAPLQIPRVTVAKAGP